MEFCPDILPPMVADVPDLHNLPTEIANCIAERLTAAQLPTVEERVDFQSLNLGPKSSPES